jgi:FAD/FMN-containing dehydrogenase
MSLIGDLSEIVGERHVVTDRALCSAYENDMTGRFSGAALAVVRPASAQEVAAVLQVCGQHGQG